MRLVILLTAVVSLARHRLRTGLTVLGIGIGIAAVICTAALGAASAQQVKAQIDNLGEDFLWIKPGSLNIAGVHTGFGGARTLTADDAEALQNEIPEIASCSPLAQGREQIQVAGSNWNTRFQGVLPSFFQIRRRTFAAGGPFADIDVRTGARVMVVGSAVVDRLFDGQNPVGQTVRMNGFPFRILGVLEARGADRTGADRDDVVFVPFTTADRYLERREWVSDVMCAVSTPGQMDAAEAGATSLLRVRHNLVADDPDDFTIQKPLDVIEMRAQAGRTFALLLLLMGSVSLVVAGVGIMNIMLVSVAERQREIGVRLAIGARVRDIRLQFLVEAATLGLAGGLVGNLVGWAGARLLSAQANWPTLVSPEVALWATVAAIGAGIAFGSYPAYRASRLDPIDAIRTESA